MARLKSSLAVFFFSAVAAYADETVVVQPAKIRINPVAQQPLDALSATVTRPLFAASRRKPVPVPPPVVQPVIVQVQPSNPEPPPVVLTGVVSTPQGMIAILSQNSGQKSKLAKVGEDLSGWRISEITEKRIIVEQGDRRFEMSMFQPSGQVSVWMAAKLTQQASRASLE